MFLINPAMMAAAGTVNTSHLLPLPRIGGLRARIRRHRRP
jgi:hypothetical protein